MKVTNIKRLTKKYPECDITTKNENFYIKSGSKYILIHNSPAVVFGIDPDNGKFFVSGKSIFKKSPRLMYSLDDVKNDRYFKGMAEVQYKFSEAFKYLSKLNFKGIYQGDLMFTKDDKKVQTVNGKKLITFKPNTITYGVDATSDLGKKISKSNLGIVIHTQYLGKVGNLKPNFKIDVNKFKNSPGVWITDAYIENQTSNLTFTNAENEAFNKLLSIIKQEKLKVNDSKIDSFNDTALVMAMETTINSYIRKGTYVTDFNDFFENLEDYIINKYEKLKSGYKSDAKKLEVQTTLDDTLTLLRSNKDELTSLMTIHNAISTAKMMVVKKLEEIKSNVKTFTQTNKGFEAVGAEGFCAVVNDGSGIIKLVDRLTFSQNNFNNVKDWKK